MSGYSTPPPDLSAYQTLSDHDPMVGCVAFRNTNQSVNTGTSTLLAFTGADIFDTDGFHDPAGANPGQLIVPAGKGGWYQVWANISIATGGNDTSRQAWIEKNGSTMFALNQARAPAGGQVLVITLSGVIDLAVSDYVNCKAWHDAGVALNYGANISLFGLTKIART